MRKDNIVIWDDFLPADGLPHDTSSLFDDHLGKYDQIALFAVLTAVESASGIFDARLVHSGDGETFVAKNVTANGELHGTWGPTKPTAAVVVSGSDPNILVNPPTPFLRYVRLRITLMSASSVHCRVYATLRDQGG